MTMLATAPVSGGTAWMADAVCYGHTAVFFAPPGERPEAREVREAKARSICHTCPVMTPCRNWARDNREYGFWGAESEEERAAAGFRVEMPVGRIARYPRGEGKPVQARPDRATRQRLANTEELRKAMLHYRALFQELLGERRDGQRSRPEFERSREEGAVRAEQEQPIRERQR